MLLMSKKEKFYEIMVPSKIYNLYKVFEDNLDKKTIVVFSKTKKSLIIGISSKDTIVFDIL
jgi:hypothetical protein